MDDQDARPGQSRRSQAAGLDYGIWKDNQTALEAVLGSRMVEGTALVSGVGVGRQSR